MVPALPWLRNRWRRQQLGTLALMSCLVSPLVRLWKGKLQGGIIKEDMLREGALGSTGAAHTQHPLPGEGVKSPTWYPHCLQPHFKYGNQGKHLCGANVEILIPCNNNFVCILFSPSLTFAYTWLSSGL